jgi:hypothetical protein
VILIAVVGGLIAMQPRSTIGPGTITGRAARGNVADRR